MAKIRISKEFDFEMAHALEGYDGPCKNIHGHSYGLIVTVIGEPQKEGAKKGMVMDFGDLKRIVKNSIIDHWDHALLLNENQKNEIPKKSIGLFAKVQYVNYQPTSENMLVDIVEKIERELPKNIKLHSLFLRETARSWAEWYAEDNK